MLVTIDNFHELIHDLAQESFPGFDTETYGKRREDRLFSLAIATENNSYYLNFNADEDHQGRKASVVLNYSVLGELLPYTEDESKTWCAHNVSFDMQKLALEGLTPPKKVHCTYVAERIIRNDSLDLTLEAVAKKYGYAKDMRVEEYIAEHKLWTQVQVPGKDKRDKVPHFDKVPFKLMAEYGENDAVIHRKIGLRQIAKLNEGIPK